MGLTVIVAGTIFLLKNKSSNQEGAKDSPNGTIESQISENGDLMISIADITEKANFYGYDVDGTKLEVIAIKEKYSIENWNA